MKKPTNASLIGYMRYIITSKYGLYFIILWLLTYIVLYIPNWNESQFRWIVFGAIILGLIIIWNMLLDLALKSYFENAGKVSK